MEKFSVFFVKYVVVPVALGGVAFYVIGPKIGGSGEAHASNPSTLSTDFKDDTTSASDTTAAPDVPVKSAPKAVAPDAASDSAVAKFDPDVPVNAGDGGNTAAKASTTAPSPGDPTVLAGNTADASVVKISKPKPRKRRAIDPNAPTDTGSTTVAADTAPTRRRALSPDEGPGADIKNPQPKKPKKDPAKDPVDPSTLPSTPPGGGDGGTTTGDGGG